MVGILDEMCPKVQEAIIRVVPSNITCDKKLSKYFFQLHIFLGTSILQIPLTRKMFYSLFHISQTTKILGRRHYIRQLFNFLLHLVHLINDPPDCLNRLSSLTDSLINGLAKSPATLRLSSRFSLHCSLLFKVLSPLSYRPLLPS